MKLLIGNYLQQREEAPSKVGLGLDLAECLNSKRNVNAFVITSNRVSKEWNASTFKRVWSRECFIEVYIDNQCKIVIVYDCKWWLYNEAPSCSVAYNRPSDNSIIKTKWNYKF